MEIISEFKYEKLLTHKFVDEMAVKFLNLFEVYQQNNLSKKEMELCKKLAQYSYHQDDWYEIHLPNYIKPEEMTLENPTTKRTCQYSYVPLKEVAKKYLQNKSILEKILSEQKDITRRTKKGLKNSIKSAMDAEISHRIRGKLKMEFYVDDVETTKSNGLGSNHKILNFYLTCADLPIENKFHSDSMEKIISVERAELKSLTSENFDPLNELFKIVRKDMTDLMTNGLKVTNSKNESVVIQATLSHQCGDNLGIYEMLGLSQSFNNNAFYCRFCGWSGKERDGEEGECIQNHCFNPPLITSDFDEKARDLLSKSSKRAFVLDGLPGITRFNIAPTDTLHDLPEGTLPEFVCRMCTRIVEKSIDSNQKAYNIGNKKSTAANVIETKFEEFQYHEGRPSFAWSKGSFYLKGKATQVCN